MGDSLNGYEKQVTRKYPDVPVLFIDGGDSKGPNTKSVYFSMYGTSYLAGIIAANQTKTGKIGVIAGTDAPVLRGFTDGFIDGANRENSDIITCISYIADDFSGFSKPETAGVLTSDMYRNGTDIIYLVAGSSGTGVIRTAEKLPGMLVIGSDADQSGLAPGTVIASAVKSLDLVIYDELQDIFSESYAPGSTITGLQEGGSSLVLNPRFDDLSSILDTRIPEAIEKEKEYLDSHPPV
jgi:basic membrane protein A